MPITPITPESFVAKWRASNLKERSAAQSHFNDLCALLGQPSPTDIDPDGTWFTFEKGASKLRGNNGWADVWRRNCFGWEYKGKHKDLKEAFAQLQTYAIALENPPLLVVSDMDTIRIHTNFTNTVQEIHIITLDDILLPETRRKLTWLFTDPERFRPGVTRQAITEHAAEKFAGLAQSLQAKGHAPERVAHFVNKLLFCMFAEDIEILPRGVFTKLLESAVKNPGQFEPMAKALFSAMQSGGFFGADAIAWFNGGLFEDSDVLPLEKPDLELALAAARLDWSDIEPSIFGTLFERGLDPAKRSMLGAHYTDRQSIMRIVDPVVIQPLLAEWAEVKAAIEVQMHKFQQSASKGVRTKALSEAQRLFGVFRERLAAVRVLDPACGSGNFLYLVLLGLKDLDHQVCIDFETMFPGYRAIPAIAPSVVMGIELNPYAAELARITIWIGHIQWLDRHGFTLDERPVLQKMDQIACRDAVMTADGTEAAWPDAEFIVGNPPFLGDRKMKGELGPEYVNRLRSLYEGRVPGGADLVTYWFEKARQQLTDGRARRAGFVTTNSIRGGLNRRVLERICETGSIFEAWSDEPWTVDGAAVRVSIVCFADASTISGANPRLDGAEVEEIYADLTSRSGQAPHAADLTQAQPQPENQGVSFRGSMKSGPFDVDAGLARAWLQQPSNPNGRPNADVVKPSLNGMDITRRPKDGWIVDFGAETSENEAAFYEAPFEHVNAHVKPFRFRRKDDGTWVNTRDAHRTYWWRHGDPRPALRQAIAPLSRFIVTPEVAKHRLFTFLPTSILPDHQLIAIARDDDTTLGILHSRFHELWALRLGTSLEDRPRYTPSTTFETFPFPAGLEPNLPTASYADDPRAVAIAAAACALVAQRDAWLNPPELVDRLPEVVPGFPDRLVPKNEQAAAELKRRTLTNLYNQKPQWLVNAHHALDAAVAAAYGWPVGIDDDEALARLLALNLERGAAAGRQ